MGKGVTTRVVHTTHKSWVENYKKFIVKKNLLQGNVAIHNALCDENLKF